MAEHPIIIHCQRCHIPCHTGKPDPEARLLQLSEGPKGLCVNCAVTQFFKDEKYGVSLEQLLRGTEVEKDVTRALLLPHIQEQFTAILRVGCAQVVPEQIDWLEVVANWDLPFDRKTIKPRKQ